jgi:hypothetical protein
VIERVGGRCRPQRMRADLEAELDGISAHHLIDAVRRDRLVELAGRAVTDWPE